MESISEDQLFYIRTAVTISSSLSILGTVFIIGSFFAFKKLRSTSGWLIVSLSAADFFVGFINLFIWSVEFNSKLCQIQAFGLQFTEISAFSWSGCIAFHALQAIHFRKSEEKLQSYYLYYLLISVLIPLLFALIPFTVNGYGFSTSWCWVTTLALRLPMFYIPAVLIWIFDFVIYFYLQRKIKQTMRISAHARTANIRTTLYILVFIISTLPGLINRLHNLFDPKPLFWMYMVQASISPLQGLGNSIVYGFSKKLRMEYKETFSKKNQTPSERDPILKSPPVVVVVPDDEL